MNPLKSISFRDPEPPRRYSFQTLTTLNDVRHTVSDDCGWEIMRFTFKTYDEFCPPPDRNAVLRAAQALLDAQCLSILTDRGTKDYHDD